MSISHALQAVFEHAWEAKTWQNGPAWRGGMILIQFVFKKIANEAQKTFFFNHLWWVLGIRRVLQGMHVLGMEKDAFAPEIAGFDLQPIIEHDV